MATVREFIETLEDPYRIQLLSYIRKDDIDDECESLAKAVTKYVIWDNTKEGRGYWIDVFNGVKDRSSKYVKEEYLFYTKNKIN
jgi:hypothetical protein